ncbi:MAG: MFS transporter [Frankia sp.]
MSRPTPGGTYRDVLRLDGALRAFVPAALTRLSYGTLPLALLLTIQTASGSFATGGLALAVFGIATMSLPLKSRLIDRHGKRRVLGWLGVSYPLVLLILAGAVRATPKAPSSSAVLVVLTAGAGLLTPPIGPSMRAVWVALSPTPDAVRRAYSLDTVAEECLFTLGPTIVGALLAVASPVVAVGLSAGLAAVGTLGLATAPSPVADPVADRGGGSTFRRARRGAGPPGGLAGILGAVTALGLGAGMLEVGVTARAEAAGATAQAGYLLAMLSAGSAVGGMAWGRRDHRGSFSGQVAALLAAFAAGCTGAAFAPDLIVVGADLFLAGLVVAPAFIATYLAVERRAAAARRTEASSWVSTAHNLGQALGASVAGLVVDARGARVALFAAAVPVAVVPVAVAVAAIVRRRAAIRRRPIVRRR